MRPGHSPLFVLCLDASPPKSPVYPSIFSVGRPARVSTKFARLESFASFDDTDDHEFSDDDFDWNECVNEIDAREFRDQAAAAGSGFSLGLGQASKLVSSPPTALLPPAGDRLTFDEGLASAEHSSFTPSRTNGSRPTPHLDGHRELPGMIGSLVRGSRKCTCSCTCGAVDYNRSVGFEPVPPRTTRMDKQPNGPTMNEFGREVPPPLAQSKGAKAAEALAAARSFQTTTCTSPSTFGSALSSSNSLINQRAGLGESDAHTNVPNLARSIEAGKSLAASTSSIQQWAGGPAVGQLSMTDRANVTATKPPPLDGAMEPELSAQQKAVLDMVMKKQSLMFTGGAGTGKSVLARALVRKLRQTYNWDDAVAVCALTGIAALHIGGQTIHAWAGVGLGNKPVQELIKVVKKSKASTKRWLAAQVLLVDEVSMMDAVLFDKLEELARSVRQSSKPFGGIQLVLIGDFYQLPPVITAPTFFGRHDYQAQLKLDYQELCKTYVSRYLFHAKTWTKCIPRTVILRQVFRQADQTFVRMLEETRRGELKPATITQFYRLSRPLSVADGIQPTELYSTRSQVADANLSRLKALPGDVHTYKSLDQSFVHGQQREFTSRYKGGDDGDTQARIKEYLDKRAMAPAVVELKEGAQVMLIKNLINGLVNGSRGIVTGFMDTSSLQVASEQSGRCFFSDPNAQLTTKLVKRKVSKLRRVPKSGAVRAKCVVNAVASEGRPSAGPSVDVKTSPPSDGATEAVSGQGSGNAAPSVGAENLQAAPINVGPSSAENSDVTMPVAGHRSDPKAIPACTTAGAAFEDSEWSYEEYETEEEVVEEEPPPRIELAVASGSKAQDDLGAGRSKLSAFMRVHSHPPASRGAGPGLEYAHAGVKYPLVRFVDGSTMLMVPLKFNVESPVGADEASRVQVRVHVSIVHCG